MDIIKHIEKHADQSFIIGRDGHTLSYQEVFHRALGAVASLRNHGVRQDGRVGLLMDNSVEMVLLYWACLLGGFTAVPVNVLLSTRDLEYILRHAGMDVLVTRNADVAPIPGGPVRICLDGAAGDGDPPSSQSFFCMGSDDLLRVDLDRILTISFTSGTTSRPKAVPHTARGLLDAAVAFNHQTDYTSSTRMYHVLPMGYMAGFLNTLLCPFAAGGSVVLGESFNARSVVSFWDLAMRHNVNALWLAPTIMAIMNMMDRHPEAQAYCREHISSVCCGTAPLPTAVKTQFEEKYQLTVYESYGLSETLFVSTNGPGIPYKRGSVGRSLAGVGLQVTDEAGNALSPEQEGDISIAVPWMMPGYLDLESGETTSPRTPFPSGDVGYLDGDGLLYITGRKKDLIIRGGKNISPRTIEELLLEHAGVRDAAVIGIPHPLLGEEIVACIVPAANTGKTEFGKELAAHCRALLAAQDVPGQYRLMKELPKSATGKIQKQVLRENFSRS